MKVKITRMYRGWMADAFGGFLQFGHEYDVPEEYVRELANRQPPHCELPKPEPEPPAVDVAVVPKKRYGKGEAHQ